MTDDCSSIGNAVMWPKNNMGFGGMVRKQDLYINSTGPRYTCNELTPPTSSQSEGFALPSPSVERPSCEPHRHIQRGSLMIDTRPNMQPPINDMPQTPLSCATAFDMNSCYPDTTVHPQATFPQWKEQYNMQSITISPKRLSRFSNAQDGEFDRMSPNSTSVFYPVAEGHPLSSTMPPEWAPNLQSSPSSEVEMDQSRQHLTPNDLASMMGLQGSGSMDRFVPNSHDAPPTSPHAGSISSLLPATMSETSFDSIPGVSPLPGHQNELHAAQANISVHSEDETPPVSFAFTAGGKYVCTEDGCGLRFDKDEGAKEHYLESHGKGSRVPAGKIRYACDILGCPSRLFKNKAELLRHQKTPHMGDLTAGKTGLIKCRSCGEEFEGKRKMQQHFMASHYSHPKTYECDYSGCKRKGTILLYERINCGATSGMSTNRLKPTRVQESEKQRRHRDSFGSPKSNRSKDSLIPWTTKDKWALSRRVIDGGKQVLIRVPTIASWNFNVCKPISLYNQ